jgi:hypothetical protein
MDTTYQEGYVPYGWMEPCWRRRNMILHLAAIHAPTREWVRLHPEVLATEPS